MLGVFAETYPLLILARVIQAAGTSSVSALGMQMITRYFPVEEKAKAMSIYASASTLGFGLGPLVGGLLTEYLGWSFLFMVSVLGALMIRFIEKMYLLKCRVGHYLISRVLIVKYSSSKRAAFCINRQSVFSCRGCSFALFLIHINRVKEPFIAPSLLKQPIYVLSLAIGFAVFLSILPFYLLLHCFLLMFTI
nr:MFS transporter [Sinobaca sp. H24]